MNKNLEWILSTIAAFPGIKTTEVRRRLCQRNDTYFGRGQYTWYFSTRPSSYFPKMGMDFGYWEKDAKGHLSLTDAGFARLDEFKAKW